MSNEPEKIIYTMMRVSKTYQNKPVLKDISLSYFYGAKIGVLGLNGSGKSSLLRILAGADREFNGETHLSPGKSVGLVEQEPELDDSKTVREIVEEGVGEAVELLAEFNRISESLAEPMEEDEMMALIERQGDVQEKPLRGGSWAGSAEDLRVFARLGFRPARSTGMSWTQPPRLPFLGPRSSSCTEIARSARQRRSPRTQREPTSSR